MRKIIIMGIPHHGNLGDNAIAVAEESIINTYFKNEFEIYEMPEDNLQKCVKRVKEIINEEDIILLHGGGNIGDTYEIPERGRKEVIRMFPENKIIIFPQTMYFSKTDYGNSELEISKEIYNSHANLVMMAREKKSYESMKEHFYNAKIYLTPDIVMTFKIDLEKNRNGVLFLLRNDKEKTIENQVIKEIIKKISCKYKKYSISDMNFGETILNNVGGKYREELLNKKFEEVASSELVITDRLHGMIFSAITETPCIVFNNFNHKISESYNWLKNLNYIKYCENINNFDFFINEINNIDVNRIKYDNNFALNSILEILKKEIE